MRDVVRQCWFCRAKLCSRGVSGSWLLDLPVAFGYLQRTSLQPEHEQVLLAWCDSSAAQWHTQQECTSLGGAWWGRIAAMTSSTPPSSTKSKQLVCGDVTCRDRAGRQQLDNRINDSACTAALLAEAGSSLEPAAREARLLPFNFAVDCHSICGPPTACRPSHLVDVVCHVAGTFQGTQQ